MKKYMAALLAMLMLLTMVLTASAEEVWQGETMGFAGNVTVTLVKDAETGLYNVTVTGDKETPDFGGAAIPKLQESLQAAQSPDIDVVAGATVTSNAVIKAARQAFDAAKGVEKVETQVADGVYTGEAVSYSTVAVYQDGEVKVVGGIIRAEVTFEGGKIVSIALAESKYDKKSGEVTWITDVNSMDTNGLGSEAAVQMPERIIAAQTVGVDTVSGATITSNAIRLAVTRALESAGAGDSFYAAAEKPEATEQVLYTDVVVVGSGASGTAAALASIETGAEVIWLEKLSITGGAAQTSGGAFQAMSTLNREGYSDESYKTAELYLETLYDDLTDVSHAQFWHEQFKGVQSTELTYDWVSYPLNRYLAQNGDRMIRWIQEDLGIEMLPPTSGGGSGAMYRSYRPTTTVTYNDGTTVKGEGGRRLLDPLREDFEQNYDGRGTLFVNTRAHTLIMDENNVCIGVKATDTLNNIEYTIYARGGVVLCTGGYENNEEMMLEYAPLGVHTVTLGADSGDEGDGIRMGMDVGADYYFSGYFPDAGDTFANAPDGQQSTVLSALLKVKTPIVTDLGYRYGGLTTSHLLMLAASEQNLITHSVNGGFYKIFASGMPGITEENYAYLEFGTEFGGVYKADTLEELCQMMGFNYENMQATINTWNAIVDGTVEDEFGVKQADAAAVGKLENGPWYCFKYGHANNSTFGGLMVNLDGQVLRKVTDHAENELVESGEPIVGLYAAGEMTTCEFYGQKYVSGGTSIAFGMTIGKAGGEHAANRALGVSNGTSITRDAAKTGGDLQYKLGNGWAIFSGAKDGADLGITLTAPVELADVTSVTVKTALVDGVDMDDPLVFAANMAAGTSYAELVWQDYAAVLDGRSTTVVLPFEQKNTIYLVSVSWNGGAQEQIVFEYVNPEGTIYGAAVTADEAMTTVGGKNVKVTMHSAYGNMLAREAKVTGSVAKDANGVYRAGVEIRVPERVAPGEEFTVTVTDETGAVCYEMKGWKNGTDALYGRSISVKPDSMTGKNTGTSTIYYLEFAPEVTAGNKTYNVTISYTDYQPLDDVFTVTYEGIVLE